MSAKISVTVAAIVQREGRFLLVEEETEEGVRINQPAGHLEPGESLTSAAAREALEETAWHFTPAWLLGVYRWQHARSGVTYVRFAFGGEVDRHEPARRLDAGILRAVWLTPAELKAQSPRHRSPLVQRCVEDCLAGKRFPLDLIADIQGQR